LQLILANNRAVYDYSSSLYQTDYTTTDKNVYIFIYTHITVLKYGVGKRFVLMFLKDIQYINTVNT